MVEKHGHIPIQLNAYLQNHHIFALFKKCWPWPWKCYHIFKACLGPGVYSKGFLWQCMEKVQVYRYEEQRHKSVLLTTIRPSFCFKALKYSRSSLVSEQWCPDQPCQVWNMLCRLSLEINFVFLNKLYLFQCRVTAICQNVGHESEYCLDELFLFISQQKTVMTACQAAWLRHHIIIFLLGK